MANTGEAIVTPALLVWGRESIGLTVEDAARSIGVTPERLREWEAGASHPTIRQAREAARVYRRPFAAFYLPEPPRTFSVPHDFRTLGNQGVTKRSPALLSELRRVDYQRSLFVDLTDGKERPEWQGSSTPTDSVEDVAGKARTILGVDTALQSSWGSVESNVFREWRSAFERAGVLVFQVEGVDVSEMRGAALPNGTPAIVANGKDSMAARVFTLCHEFAHLLLNTPGICDLTEEMAARTPDAKIERFCNEVAAAMLLPGAALTSMMGLHPGESLQTLTDGDWQALAHAADFFGVSREVVMRRLVSLKRAPFALFRIVLERSQAEHRARLEKLQQAAKKGRGPEEAMKVLIRSGPAYTRTILEAYDREDITSSDVAEFLGVRLKHLPRVRELAFVTYDEGAVG